MKTNKKLFKTHRRAEKIEAFKYKNTLQIFNLTHKVKLWRETMRYFVLLSGTRETNHVFTGSQPRRAALKAATRGFKEIKLRERGTDKMHVFRGARRRVRAPEGSPDWLPSMVWKPVVRKVKLERTGRRGSRRVGARKPARRRRARRAKRRVARRKPARRARRRTARRPARRKARRTRRTRRRR